MMSCQSNPNEQHYGLPTGLGSIQMYRSTLLIFIYGFFLTLLVLTSFNASCSAIVSTNNLPVSCQFFSTFKDFQTLIASGIAIIAAVVTVTPVWKQQSLMESDLEITKRNLLSDIIKMSEQGFTDLNSKFIFQNSYGRDFSHHDGSPISPIEFNTQYALSLSHDAREHKILISNLLHNHQYDLELTKSLTALLATTTTIFDLLNYYHEIDTCDFDPEFSPSETERVEIEKSHHKASTELGPAFHDLASQYRSTVRTWDGFIQSAKIRLSTLDGKILFQK